MEKGKFPGAGEDDKNPLEELTKQFSDILGKMGANVQFSSNVEDAGKRASRVSCEQELDAEKAKQDAIKRIRNFNLKPKEVKEYLDRFVISQNEAKKVLSVAICDHYNHVRKLIDSKRKPQDYVKQNVLILGPTGVGKTYLVKNIAKLIGVPFVKADATKFSETGYVGGDVEDLVRNLVKAANGDVELAQYGIVFIDEIDKITNVSGENSRDVTGRGVQINLLKLMEETEVNVMSQTDMLNQMRSFISFGSDKSRQPDTINTRNILFIVSGAFDKIGKIIQARIGHHQIGFGAELGKNGDGVDYDLLRKVTTEDFVNYGFEPEFIGRLPVRVACQSLSESDLREILCSSEGSILAQYENDFDGYGISLQVEQEALDEIAKLAVKEKTGARGLLTILESTFRDLKYELPSTNINFVKMTKEGILNPRKFLEHTLLSAESECDLSKDDDFERFIDAFEVNYGLSFEIDPEARAEIRKLAESEGKHIISICGRLFKDFGYGFHLIADKIDSHVLITIDAVKNPDKFLSDKITQYFGTPNPKGK